MERIDVLKRRRGFQPLLKTRAMQAAVMVLQPGESSSNEIENEHPRAEQWLYVISGVGEAQAPKKRLTLRPGSLLLIERAEKHRITNIADEGELVTLNFYSPPAYTDEKHVAPGAR